MSTLKIFNKLGISGDFTLIAVKLRLNKFALSEKRSMFVMKLEMKITSFILNFKA